MPRVQRGQLADVVLPEAVPVLQKPSNNPRDGKGDWAQLGRLVLARARARRVRIGVADQVTEEKILDTGAQDAEGALLLTLRREIVIR